MLLYTLFFLCFILNLGAISKYKPPGLEFAGLMQEEGYFLNFTVFGIQNLKSFQDL